MNRQEQDSNFEEAMKHINEYGLDGMGNAIQILINTAMKLERENHLKASSYQRTEERLGYGNGFKEKTVKSRVGCSVIE